MRARLLQDDFNNQLWNVVMLAMGGSALGEAVKSSGLLSAIAHGIQDLIVGCGTWQVLAIFCALVLVATTFISHTVGAMVILPIVQAVGADMTVIPAHGPFVPNPPCTLIASMQGHCLCSCRRCQVHRAALCVLQVGAML